MIEHIVKLFYIVTSKREMSVHLPDFIDNKAKIKKFEKHDKVDGVSVMLIKNQVLEMAEETDFVY
jgi:hypothetical protein